MYARVYVCECVSVSACACVYMCAGVSVYVHVCISADMIVVCNAVLYVVCAHVQRSTKSVRVCVRGASACGRRYLEFLIIGDFVDLAHDLQGHHAGTLRARRFFCRSQYFPVCSRGSSFLFLYIGMR